MTSRVAISPLPFANGSGEGRGPEQKRERFLARLREFGWGRYLRELDRIGDVKRAAREGLRRRFDDPAAREVAIYRCPGCDREFVAMQEEWTTIPTVKALAPLEPGETFPGTAFQGRDILAANPDPEGKVWSA